MLDLKEKARRFRLSCRRIRLYTDIKELKNENPTIISQNCYAGTFLNDHKMRFMSPTINMYFSGPDFIKFCKDIEKYTKIPLVEVNFNECPYPVAKIDDIFIHLVHYKNFDEANKKWVERCERIDLNNLYFIMSDRDGCRYEDLAEFDKLECKNKVVFVNKSYPEIKSSRYIKGYEDEQQIGRIYLFKNIFGKRILDDSGFNFADFIKNRN